TPPDGAVEVKQLTFGAKSALTGKTCPDFELVTLDGKSITRAALKGQTILLQFGLGTDDEMFPAELAYRALRGNGLHVVYVAPIRVNADNYSVPVAIDQRSAVAGKFGMHSGMVLIDRFGRIAYTGASSSSSYQGLAQALQDAGVW
ncbi:MAG: TlpA family protein disulfide reductase, partial [Bacteroidota bacterium]